jgi:hypothetical protein
VELRGEMMLRQSYNIAEMKLFLVDLAYLLGWPKS